MPARFNSTEQRFTNVPIPAEWLTIRVEDIPTSYHRTLSPKTALRIRMTWQKLKRQATGNDEMWAFSSPRDRQTGYAIVRDGEVLESIVIPGD